MFEDYLKKIEEIITPNYYNKKNFKEKIKGELEDPFEFEEKQRKQEANDGSAIDNKRLMEEYLKKMNMKEPGEEGGLSDSKLKIYKKILENTGTAVLEEPILSSNTSKHHKVNSNSAVSKNNKTYSQSPSRRIFRPNEADEMTLKEKIHNLNIKNMNHRYEIETLKNKISEKDKLIEEQKIEMAKLDKQNENNNKYLVKLENLVSQRNLNLNFNKSQVTNLNFGSYDSFINHVKTSKSENNVIVDFNRMNNLVIEDRANQTVVNITDKNDLKELISNLIQENQKLKQFQNQVYEISKNYDDINQNMVEGIKNIQDILNNNLSDIENKSDKVLHKIEGKAQHDLNVKLEVMITNIEKTLESKQNEYNFLLDSKDKEIKFLQDEILKLNELNDFVKRDRMRDQKMLNDYETQINLLNTKLHEIGYKSSDSTNVKDQNSSKIEKKIAPAKTTVNRIIKKIEKNFDLQDKNNIRLLSNINKSLK